MADDGDVTQTAQAPAPDLSGLTSAQLADLYKQIMNPPPAAAPKNTGPSSREGRSFVSLLGEGLGGGQQYGTTAEREQGGFGALAALGARMLQASDYSYVPHSFGAILGQGLGAAQEQLGRQQAVSAAQQAAAQQTQHQQQQDQLARLRTALPLLQLQANQRAVAGVPYTVGGGGKPGTAAPGTSIATGGSIAPPDINSPAGEVAKRTAAFWSGQGLTPEQVAGVMAAGPGAESSFNPTATGDDGASHGMYQHQGDRWTEMTKRYGPNPTEAQQHEFAAWEISPEGPRAAVGAQLRAAKTPEEAARIWTTGFEAPKNAEAEATKRASAAGRYVGYGQPPPGQASAPAMAPVGTQPPNTPAQIPPAALPAPVQTAGPGAPTALAAPVQTTTEPETGAPVVMPSAPGSGPPVFRYTPSQIPPGLIPSGTFTPEQQQAVKTIQDAYVHERQVALTPADVQKAESNFGTNMTKVLGSQTDAAKVATDALLKFHEADFKQQQDTHAKVLADFFDQQKFAREDAAKQAAVAQAHKNALEATEAQQNGQIVVEDRKRFGLERDGARKTIDTLQTLHALSDAAGTGTPLDQITLPGGITGRQLMANMGLGTQAQQQKWGAQEAFEAVKNGMTTELRAGIAMGQLSDRDLIFLQGMGPKLIQSPETRNSLLNILETAQTRKREYIDKVDELYEGGMPWTKAKREAGKAMPEIVPQVPAGLTPDQRIEFFRQRIPKGSIFRGPDSVTHDGKVILGDIMIAPMVGY